MIPVRESLKKVKYDNLIREFPYLKLLFQREKHKFIDLTTLENEVDHSIC